MTGHSVPVVMNLFGTRERMALALGVEQLDDVGDRIRALLDLRVGGGMLGMLSNLPKVKEVTSLPPKRVRARRYRSECCVATRSTSASCRC